MPWSREIRAGHGHPNGRLGRGERHCAPQRRAAGRPVWTTDVQPRVPCGCPVSPWPFFLLLAQGPLSVLRRSPQACLPLISSPWGGRAVVALKEVCPPAPQSSCFLRPGAPGRGNLTQPRSDLRGLLRALRSSPRMGLVGQVAWAGANPSGSRTVTLPRVGLAFSVPKRIWEVASVTHPHLRPCWGGSRWPDLCNRRCRERGPRH